MITWTKIIFTISFLYVWFSTVGVAVSEFLKIDVKKYYFPIGLITVFGLYEIVMYYPIMFHLNRIYSGITIYILLGISSIYFLLNTKRIIKEIISIETIISLSFVVFGFIILYFFNPMMDIKSDYEFYLSLIRSANELEPLGIINYYQSGIGVLSGNHLLYGFYYLKVIY